MNAISSQHRGSHRPRAFFFSRWLLLLGMLACCASAWAAPSNMPTASAELIKRGEYVARLGDCVACHTSLNGAAMAGGLELKTPFGTIYSTNITPDAKTGLGTYSFVQFDRAMRKGVAADGHNLYPAMPYPSYAKITPDDMQALTPTCSAAWRPWRSKTAKRT